MKTKIHFSLILFLSIICLSASAQVGKIIVFAPQGEKFSLFLGGSMQNTEPAARVESDNPGGPTYKIRIVFPDASVKEISKLVFNKPSSTMYYKVSKTPKGTFMLESTTSEWMEDSGNSQKGTPPPTEVQPDKKESRSDQAAATETKKTTGTKGCNNPISDADFTAQLIDISARPFEPMQLSAAKKMAETHCLLVSQVTLVINVFDSESSRLSFAKYAYDYTYDRQNYMDVKDALHSQSSKNDLDKFIKGK